MEAILEKILRREIPHCRALISAERLSGGASQETYRLEHERLQALLGAGGELSDTLITKTIPEVIEHSWTMNNRKVGA